MKRQLRIANLERELQCENVVGDSAQFLRLSVEENRFIELKLALALITKVRGTAKSFHDTINGSQ